MLARWLSCTGQSIVENQVEQTSETTLDHACNSSNLLPVQAIKSDGSKCYDYALLYVDDLLVVSENAESIIRNEMSWGGTLS